MFLAIPLTLAHAQAAATLSINPSSTSLDAGQSATLAVRITDVTDLYAYDITLHYDPSILEITSIENGSFLKGGFTAAQVLDKQPGTAQIAFTSIPPFTSQSGSGDLATFKVKAKAGGSARITIENIQLLKQDATAIDAAAASGSVTVTGTAATAVSRPITDPGGTTGQSQSQKGVNPGVAVSTTESSMPTSKPTDANPRSSQPTEKPTVRSTVVPAAPLPTLEPEQKSGVSPLVWMIPLGLALLAAGYFGGNFLRERMKRK
jgi:hypothetical protein